MHLSQYAPGDETAISLGSQQDALDALVNAMAIKAALRLQTLGYRPALMGGRVGLLAGLRTEDMDKYDKVRLDISHAIDVSTGLLL